MYSLDNTASPEKCGLNKRRKTNVTEFLDYTCNMFPNKIAINDIKSKYTFLQLKQAAKEISRCIIKHKIFNIPVAVYMPKSCDTIITFAAISYSNNFYVPIDINSPLNRIKNIFNTLQLKIAITNTEYLDTLRSFYEGVIICVDDINNDTISDQADNNSELFNLIDADPVYCIFTSGSTGTPKGVVVSHKGVIDYIEWAIETFNVDEKAIIANQAPFYFDNSTLDIYLMFATGATLYIVPEKYYIFPAKLIEFLNQEKVNFVFWVPSVLVNIANFNLLEEQKPEYLEKILFAGEVMPNKHLNYWRKHLPKCLYANLYGPTEITVDCTYYIVNREFGDDEPLPIGIPCRNSGILIMNEKNELADINEQGELCVKGSSLALGYYNNQEKTDKVFVQNPLNHHYNEIIYRTGDIAYWNENGEIMYVGRKDSQIKHAGYRIELGEIENAVLGTGYIKTVCVVYDKGNTEIVMFYTADTELNIGKFKKELMRFIPKYMIPGKYIRLSELPMNANDKIDRLKLSQQVNA
jgi:amino acid adenylation domain-containing protein